ncbi:hypothetical protein GCM10027570_17210 [Streptomonospora sediminis]
MTVPLPPFSPGDTSPQPEETPLPAGFAPLRDDDPTAVGPFQLVGRIGAGGMGAVYGALDGRGYHTAVKVIHPGNALDPAYRARFAREADLLSRVDAECAPAFVGANTTGPQPWLATEFVHGDTLRHHTSEYGPLSGAALTAFAAGTAEALAAVHAAGIVHRDIKPANIIVGPHGPRVLDFGIARDVADATPEEGVYGTPGWIAPERLSGETATTAADMFAWGALVAYAAAGRNPFGAGEAAALLRRTREGRADVDGVPDELLPLVERALAVDPGERPTAAEALEGVLATVAAEPDATRPDSRTRLRTLLGDTWRGFAASGRGAGSWTAAAAMLSTAGSGAGAGSAPAGGAAAAGAGAAGTAGAGTVLGMSKGVTAVVAGITATAVVAGGWAVGRLLTDQPVVPVAQEDPSPSWEPSSEPARTSEPPPAPEQSPTPSDYPQSVGFRSMEIGFPADWNVQRIQENFGAAGESGRPGEWVAAFPGGGSCDTEVTWTTVSAAGCEHVKILGPEGIELGGPGYAPIDPQTYYVPSSQLPLCPDGAALQPYDQSAAEQPNEPELAPIGSLDAYYNEYAVPCSEGSGRPESSYLQRLWLLPDSGILVVDNIGLPELNEILAQAETGG